MKLLSLTVNLAILAMLFGILEHLFTLRPVGGRREGWGRDLAFFFINNLVPTVAAALLGAVVASAFNRVLPASYHAWIAGWPGWARGAAFFVVVEIGFYWGHRWSHASPFLWRFHAVHHSAEHLDWLANTRAHPIDMVFARMTGFVPAFALGLAEPTASAHDIIPQLTILLTGLWGFFIHSNIRWRLGPLEWLIATPAFHHWHHTNCDKRDHNFASTLPWLDRLFGTHHLPRAWPSEYGIDDKSMPRDVTGQLLRPLRR